MTHRATNPADRPAALLSESLRKPEPGERRDFSILAGAKDRAPIAAGKPTAPDTVLWRLLLASNKLIDDVTLETIAQVVPLPAKNGD